jgi:hypothetical protein
MRRWSWGGWPTASTANGSSGWPPSTPAAPAGAEQGKPAASTTAWLQDRLNVDADTATSWVRTARALFPDP